MEYEEFLRERRRRMADIIRVAFRQLGGESDAPPVTPPWFLPGAEAVWQRIAETERALRGVVREVYAARFGDSAASRIEAAVPEGERQTLARNLARRPAGADPLSIVDYLYLGQLPNILFAPDVQQEARTRFTGAQDPKQRLLAAVSQIAPVRNEIAGADSRAVPAAHACSAVRGPRRSQRSKRTRSGTMTVKAVYENGVFKPKEPVDLKEHTEVEVL